MKFVTIILSLFILALAIQPCADVKAENKTKQYQAKAIHEHENDCDHDCPITCVCNCCGMPITYQAIITYNLVLNNQISTETKLVHQKNYIFSYHSNIWQPPKLIS